jgi:hypothetical protein
LINCRAPFFFIKTSARQLTALYLALLKKKGVKILKGNRFSIFYLAAFFSQKKIYKKEAGKILN